MNQLDGSIRFDASEDAVRYVYFLTFVLLFPAHAHATGPLQVAEYRADVDDVAWRVGENGNLYFGNGVTEPWGLSRQQATSSVEKESQVGPYSLTSAFDLYQGQSSSALSPYAQRSGLSVGPRFSFLPNSFTQLFVSLSRRQMLDETYHDPWGGDSFTQGTGLSQTWFLARRKAQITLGYGFEQGDTEDLYDDRRSHSVVFSSRFPLFWGLSARIQANYAHNTYQDYLGTNGANSEKQLFLAGIHRAFSQRLYGEFRFSYLNEDFGNTDLSHRRTVWGLNLRYQY